MGLNRRTFLQKAGLALFSVGVSETGISLLGNSEKLAPWLQPYVQTLAAPTNRKLALLVGVNEYPQCENLAGCLTDIELQQELLINRFGFNTEDILKLTDLQATRENIESAFLEHLAAQAKPGDVVVFHFSGYGGQVKIPATAQAATINPLSAGESYQLVDSLVPVDGILPTKGDPASNELLKDTLIYLGRSLATENVTLVLDASFSPQESFLQGNFKIRTCELMGDNPNPEGLAFQEFLKIRLATGGLQGGLKALPSSELVLAAATQDQIAVEKAWDGFNAGLFTYALTQHLWQTTPRTKIINVLQHAGETVATITDNLQQPTFQGNSTQEAVLNYYAVSESLDGAEGFVSAIDGKTVQLQLTGIPLGIIDSYGDNSCFALNVNSESQDLTRQNLLQISSRNGLKAKTQLVQATDSTPAIKVGQEVQEVIRVFPQNLGLIVGLDDLERIERVDVTSALSAVNTVTSAIVAEGKTVDCLFSKVQKTDTDVGYGLLSVAGTIIPKTLGEKNEAVKSAVSRLESQFANLLAEKLLELTVNEASSLLPLSVTLESSSKLFRQTSRVSKSANSSVTAAMDIPMFIAGSEIKLQLKNNSDRTLYCMILEVNTKNHLVAPYIPKEIDEEGKLVHLKDIAIAANSQAIIPHLVDSWEWDISLSQGITKMYVIFSTKPFSKTLNLISQIPTAKLIRPHILNITEPLAIVRKILEDLNDASAVSPDIVDPNSDVYALDTQSWAGLKFTYQTKKG
ncbi:Caspase domain-containing protein [Xenococcus sp. PCC 7305]|uniref:caspase family protein n=1 Tax=Xenococcus sp. PCC 7305 TaxID=102125 RepID=UPI0002ACC144|nr:caspase family protein [Xenococcus sp. PCC 7305]ELS01959.1 Caspase domain-containing protein [Xenococcus sp. PCC 7305]